ncbi:hypothetical protein [Clostridium sp. HBUAS56010]|uniref:hypothetical protein n=1 Tax=Clostridium sp. HBUAS56010 TaxID=2571127 RepID=UPI0011782001|nr:hypothetical protein [Clostridium sp. HBUAS56010]
MHIKVETGSEIKTIESAGKKSYGKRRSEALKSMIEQFRRYPSLYIELTTGKKLPWYRRFWIDKVLKHISGGRR